MRLRLMLRIGSLGYRMQGWGMRKPRSRCFRLGARLQAWAAGTRPLFGTDD